MAVVAKARRKLADGCGLSGAVHADHEDHRRLLAQSQSAAAVGGHHLLDELLEALDELALVRRLARLELLDELDGGGHADVRANQRLLDALPRVRVGRVEEELLGERLAASCERLTQAPEPASPALRLVSPLRLGVVAEKLSPARHAESACRLSGSPASLFDTIWETPSAAIVTP